MPAENASPSAIESITFPLPGRCAATLLSLLVGLFGVVAATAAPPAENAAMPDLGTRKKGEDWPSFLGPTADSKSRETDILAPWPASGLRIVWHRPAGTGYGTVAIVRGRCYEFSRYGNEARLTCLHSETGEELWTFNYPSDYEDLYNYNNGPRASPVVDEDRVYLFGAEGMLHCVSALDGKEIWKLDTMREFGVVPNFFGVGSSPVVEGDLLIVPIGGSPPEDQRVPPGQLDRVSGNGTGIVAFDKRTGQVRYKLSDELASYATPKLATIDGRRWCFHFARGGLLAFDPATGKQDFHFPWRADFLESVNASSPVVKDDLVMISEGYGPGSAVLRVKPESHELVWSDENRRRDKALGTHWNTPVELDGYVYGSSGRHAAEAELRCVELATGKVMWSHPGETRASLLYVDGHFVVLTEDARLLLIKARPDKFELLGEFAPTDPAVERATGDGHLLRPPAWNAPVLSHGLLYLRGEGRLVCLELIQDSS